VADDCLEHFAAAAWVDGEGRGPIVSDPTMEPDGMASQPPAGFIRGDVLGVAKMVLDFLVGGLKPSAGAQHDLGTGAARQVDVIGVMEMIGDLAIGHAALLVERNDGGLSVGADLTASSADGSAGLLRVPAMNPPAASAAGSLVNPDEATNGLNGNIFLKLRIDLVVLGDVAAAKRTLFGQRSIKRLLDVVSSRRRAQTMLAVSLAGRSSRGLGMLFRLTLGKGRGLPFAGLSRRLELRFEPFIFGLETSDAVPQSADATISLRATRASEGGHTVTLAERPARSCASFLH
jgi:hypothetical protein